MSGRPPLPTHMHVMAGTYRPDRHDGEEPAPPPVATVPPSPAHLGPRAAKLWDEKAALLISLDLLTQADLASLEGYCIAHERAIEAEEIVSVEGRTLSTPQGKKRHPELITAEKARADMRRYEAEFGLTPSARARLRIPVDKKKSSTSAFGEVAKAASRKPALVRDEAPAEPTTPDA